MARFSPKAVVGRGGVGKMQRAEWACAEAAMVWFQVRGAVACWVRKVLWKGGLVARPVELRRRSNVGTGRGNILAGGESCG